jgi:signal transduction histidine kinase
MFALGKIEVSIDASAFSEVSLDSSKKLAVYRIAQEQCTNIIKYAKAKKVNLTLSSDDNIFTMIIADDGIGMSKTKIAEGIGLRNIAARAGFFGGVVHINTKRGKGFELVVNLPTGITVPSYSHVS